MPTRNLAGLEKCLPRERWEQDSCRFPPYQYKDENILWNKRDEGRLPNIANAKPSWEFQQELESFDKHLYVPAQLQVP